jgi:hypothetical protein
VKPAAPSVVPTAAGPVVATTVTPSVAPHTSRQPVQFLDRNLLNVNVLRARNFAQFGYQLSVRTLFDVYLFYLPARLDRLDHGTQAENNVIHLCIV